MNWAGEILKAAWGKRKMVWVILFMGVYRSALSGVEEAPLPYSVRMWQTDDGLPQNSVFAIAQTPDGYLWVGTRGGLTRFDGIRFTPPDERIPELLERASVTALLVAADGALWIGTDGQGIFRFRDRTFTRFTDMDGLPSNQVRCLLQDQAGTLWIGTEGGLAAHRDGRFQKFEASQGLGDNSVRALCQDGQKLLAATKRGLSTLRAESSFSTKTFDGGWNRNALRAVQRDQRGRVWVGSTDGLHCLDRSETRLYTGAEGLPDTIVNCLFEDSHGQLWVGTYGGLARIIDGRVVSWPNRDGVYGDLIHTVFADAEGSLWVGARDGLYRLTPARFRTFTTQQGLTGNNVISVIEDNTAPGLWLGVWGGGVNYLQGEVVTAYPDTNILRDPVLALWQTRDNTVWVGMDFSGGLNALRNGCRTSFSKQTNLIAAPIRAIFEDSQGWLWVGTREGLNRLKHECIETYGVTNGLAADSVEVICEDSKGDIWVGTEGGLSRWRDGRFESLTHADGVGHAVTALHPDSDQTLWIGTRGGGLQRLRREKLSSFTTREGLFSDEIYEILEDDFGYFWMSCRQGIFRTAKRDFDEFERGRRRTVPCTAFGKVDGLVSVQCNGVAKPAGWKARDGRLWFPTIRGVVCVESRIETNEKPPPIVIEEVWADKKLQPRDTSKLRSSHRGGVPPPPLFRIAPGRGELELKFTALSLKAPEKNRFRYRLEGADAEWSAANPERTAHYNNLAPGSYRFRVIGCNNDGVWNETGATVALVLLPHYWQTWWFKGAILTAVGVFLALGYRIRIARLREIERLRVEIAANLHDDVGSRLTKVAMITEQVERQTAGSDRIHAQIGSISQTTREVIQAMDEIVWTINPRNDTLDNLANYIFQYAQEYFQGTGVRCRLDLPAQLPDRPISTKVRHNLFMAIKEALNNVLKHSAATEVRIALAIVESTITIRISDNGRGFDSGQSRSGEGLRNMQARLEQIGGRLALQAKSGAGATVEMEAPAQ